MKKWLFRTAVVVLAPCALGTLALLLVGLRSDVGRTEATIELARPAAEVFSWLAETDKLPRWMIGLTEATKLTEGGPRVGARSRALVAVGSQQAAVEIELITVEPPTRLGARLTSERFEQDIQYHLRETNGKTRLHLVAHTRYKDWLTRLLGPLFTGAAQRRFDENLARLKAAVEAER